jgi:hypothetical protein
MRSVDRPPAARTDRIHIRDAGDERIRSRRRRSSHCLPGRIASPCRCHTSCVMRPRRRSTNETKWEPSRSGHEGSASGLKDREWIEFACRCAAQERPPRFESRPWQGRNNAVAVRLAAGPGTGLTSSTGSKRRPKPPRIRGSQPGAGDADDGPTTAFDLYVYPYESTVSRGQRRTPRGAERHCRLAALSPR